MPGYPDLAPSPALQSSNGSQIVDGARATLSQADSLAYLVGLDGNQIERAVSEQSLMETQRTLRDAQQISRDLRMLAEEFDVARNAIRERLEQTIREHDKMLATNAEIEPARLVPASASRVETMDGPGRG
jgi:hypothetical protein